MTSNEKLLKLTIEGKYQQVKEALEQNIREESATSKSSLNKIKFINKFINHKNREDFKHVLRDRENNIFVCDGYRLILLDCDYGYNTRYSNLRVGDFFPEVENYYYKPEIDMQSLKIAIIHKAPHFMIGKSGFNPKYVKEFISFFGSDTDIYVSHDKNSPLIFVNEKDNIKGIIMPVRLEN